MLHRHSIRFKLILSIIVGCLIPYIFGSLYIKNRAEEWSNKYAIEKADFLLQKTAQKVDESLLMNMENLIDMIVIDERVLLVDDSVNSFVDYDKATFVGSTSRSQLELMTFFEGIVRTHPIINMVSYGTEQGGYVEYPEFVPESPYDPRVRPWYEHAKGADTQIISEPYMTRESKELVISIDKKVIKDGVLLGVVSLTIRLNDLMDAINEVPYGLTGYINVLSPSGLFVSCPSHTQWLMKSVYEIDSDAFLETDTQNRKAYEATIDGAVKVINVYISPYSGWKYIAVMDKSEIYLQSKNLSDLLFVIILVVMIVVLTLVFLVSDYITKPILTIAHVIGKMATFDFDKFEKQETIPYMDKKDEMGVIARSLGTMQQNFLELNNRIHTSIQQIQQVNDEMLNKNEQLVSSEEKLTAQVEEIELQREFISYLADHDPLTNLPNRRKFNDTLRKELAENVHGAIFLMDLDNFKGINDTIGHLFGDKVLSVMSAKLLEMESELVFISRFGGDEFLLLYKNYQTQENLEAFIKNLFEQFQEAIPIDKYDIKIEFSMGVSLFPEDSTDINQLIMNADLALYSAKNNGKKSYAYYSDHLGDVLKKKLDIKAVLTEAIDNDGFKLVYQPQVDIKSGEVIGYEALIRLKNYSISPSEFIEVAEEYGHIIAIGRWVTRNVVEQLYSWKEAGLELRPIAINYSARQMMDVTYRDYLYQLLLDYRIPASMICIEITENIFLENRKDTIDFLTDLRKKGIKIAVDDFGTGYSSLSYLTFLPIDTIKLDRQLCVKFLEFENVKVMDSLIALSHSLNFKVIAEGIEEVEQVKRLIVGKCDAIQGYYFSRPLEPKDVEQQHYQKYAIFQENR